MNTLTCANTILFAFKNKKKKKTELRRIKIVLLFLLASYDIGYVSNTMLQREIWLIMY